MKMKLVLLVIFATCLGLTWASHDDEQEHADYCKDYDDGSMISVFLSVISDRNPPLCKLQISAPINSTLYQVMVLGEKQHPGMFSFEYKNFTGLGRYVTCINGECQMDPFYWLVYNGTTGKLLDKGIDETYPGNDASIIWKFEETNTNDFGDNHTGTYMGPCATDPPITFSEEDILPIIIVKLSAVNDRDPLWPPVCNLPALARSGSNLGKVMEDAKNQHPKKFNFTTGVDTAHGTYVKSINKQENDDPWYWLVYDAETMELLPTGLDDTYPMNHDAYLWRFTNKTHALLENDGGGARAPHSQITAMGLSVMAIVIMKMF